MAKRPETRAPAAKRKSPKTRASQPAAASSPGTPAKTPAKTPVSSAAKRAPARSAAANLPPKIKATAAAGTKTSTAPAGKAAAKAATARPESVEARRKSDKAPAQAAAKPGSARKAKTEAAGGTAKTAKTKTVKTTTTKTAKRKTTGKPKMPRFLAADLGHPVDHDGEPIGAGSRAAMADTELQRYTLQLWRQMQSRRGVNTHVPAMERAGVTIDQIWTAGVTDRLTTSSSPDDVKRYRQKLLFRANLLESILTETVDELQRLATVDPSPPRTAGEAS